MSPAHKPGGILLRAANPDAAPDRYLETFGDVEAEGVEVRMRAEKGFASPRGTLGVSAMQGLGYNSGRASTSL